MILLKCLSNFWRSLEIPLINCEINFILAWSGNCVLSIAPNEATTFAITDTKRYVPVVILSTQNNVKLLQQLKFGLKRKINWNKYQSKITTQTGNQKKLFVLLFENVHDRIGYTEYSLLNIEIKDHNLMIDWENFFDPPIESNLGTYDSIPKISTG